MVSVVDTTANTVKVRFDLQFDENGWEHAEITAAHSQIPERPYAIVSVNSVKYFLACVFVMETVKY